MRRAVILGVGNVLLTDEGVGIHAVRRLEQMPLPDGVSVFDGGTEGFGLMDVIADLDRLVVIDCVRGGEPPGSIYCFDVGELGVPIDKFQTSVHQVGILEVLHLVELVGKRPHTTIVGVEPASLEMNMELSDVVASKLEAVTRLALEKIQE